MTCQHKKIELRYRDFPTGRSYCEQCLDCGEMVKQSKGGCFIPKYNLTKEDMEEATAFIDYKNNPNQLDLF